MIASMNLLAGMARRETEYQKGNQKGNQKGKVLSGKSVVRKVEEFKIWIVHFSGN